MIEISGKKCHRLFPSREGKSRRGSSETRERAKRANARVRGSSETRKITRILFARSRAIRAFASFWNADLFDPIPNFLFSIFEVQKWSKSLNVWSKIPHFWKFRFIFIRFDVLSWKWSKFPEKSAIGFYLPEKGKADADLFETRVSERGDRMLLDY